MRSRRVITRSGSAVRGKFPSAKTQRMVHWESQLERDACLLLEFSGGIRSFQEQPREFQILADGACHRHFPDFEVTCLDGAVGYVEVKPLCHLLRPDIQAKMARLESHLLHQGYVFWTLTEQEIRRQPRYDNLRALFGYRTPRPEVASTDTLSLLPEEPTPFRLMARHVGSTFEVMRLLADQVLSFNPDELLTLDTPVWRYEEEHDANILF